MVYCFGGEFWSRRLCNLQSDLYLWFGGLLRMDGALKFSASSFERMERTFQPTFIYLSTGSEERSESDRHRPHFRLLCCLQLDWFVGYGEICKCTAPTLNIWWRLRADVGSVRCCHQIVQIGAKFMLVMGLFVSSVCTILFG